MKKKIHKSKMTIDTLASMTHNEFTAVRKEMADEFTAVRKEMADEFTAVRKEMSQGFQNVEGSIEILRADLTKEYRKTIESNDKVITELDVVRKDEAAHDALHMRIDDTLLDHEDRIRKAERAMKKS